VFELLPDDFVPGPNDKIVDESDLPSGAKVVEFTGDGDGAKVLQ
jgi:hypothetical protein